MPLICLSGMANSQGMKMAEVIMINSAGLKKEANPDSFRDWMKKEIIPSFNKKYPAASMHLFHADRGDKKGEWLLVTSTASVLARKTLPIGSPFADEVITADGAARKAAVFLNNPGAYTGYQLVGAGNFKTLPVAGILGIHYIRVKPDRSKEFEKFVIEKLNPAVGRLLPDMQLLYYKAIEGDTDPGKYITIFTIESVAARDKYWPAGAPETEVLKKAFLPLKQLALELEAFLVEDSYLKPESGGAAAYFESVRWTDYLYSAD